jgi:hypothetical protein
VWRYFLSRNGSFRRITLFGAGTSFIFNISVCTHSACCVVFPPFQLSIFLSLCICDLSSFLPYFFLFQSFLHKTFKRLSPSVYPQSHIFHYYNNENRVNKLTHTCDLPISFDRFAVFHQMAVLYSAATCW